jgi:hypothetical protein
MRVNYKEICINYIKGTHGEINRENYQKLEITQGKFLSNYLFKNEMFFCKALWGGA